MKRADSTSKHRILLIGCGVIAAAYARIIADLPNAVICGVVGRRLDRAQAFAENYGIPIAGTEIGEVAARTSATAAVVCTPNGAHYEGVMAAAAAGLHCLCEKPLAIDPKHQAEMIASCRDKGVKLSVGYMRRFSGHMHWLRSAMENGRLGRIAVVDVTIKHYREPSYYDSWHGTTAMDGGGPFIQQGSHIIDLALWLCGGFDRVEQAVRYRVLHEIEAEDHGYAVVAYRNGAIGSITASTACVGTSRESIEVSGTEGTIVVDYDGIIDCTVPGLRMELPIDTTEHDDNLSLMSILLTDLLLAIEEDRQPFVTGESGAAATELVAAIYAAAGEPITR